MEFTVCTRGEVEIVSAQGDVDASNANQLSNLFSKEIARGTKLVILDLTRTTLVDSAGITAIVGVLPHLHASGGKIILAGCRPNVKMVFRLVALDLHFPITSTLEEALLLHDPQGGR